MSETPIASNAGKQIGRVQIVRGKGRIAGFGKFPAPTEVLWCGVNRPRKKALGRVNGWSFPPAVREMLLQELQGRTCVHFFGGLADFGVRLDLDPSTNPDFVGDAFNPPFERDQFDAVILDPPYSCMRQEEKMHLLRSAAWVARDLVIWFHTVWISTDRHLPMEKAYLVRVGNQCAIRCLQFFRPAGSKLRPAENATRGSGLMYARWQTNGIRLEENKSSGVYLGDWA
jgi:hypothetical protein